MTTTIKVSGALRDRLKEQAARDGVTLGAHLAHLAELDDRRWRMNALRDAVAGSPAEDLVSHDAEAREWESAQLGDVRR
ncbi:hypothetical protein [uncultured Microbacterium sp.]|uniref:hypothetical protein n=1 Tax=uncultured Microbacterium sp. TaxID=191216 RepID=UPI0025F982B9|nr:hypothetical protein [uncultured Microbacterium sp.]